MPSHPLILAEKDVNFSPSSNQQQPSMGAEAKGDIKSMEYHRQVLQSKLQNGPQSTYISPSDTIMSPCTAKLSAYRNKQVGLKAKPRSLFAKASSKSLSPNSEVPMFGVKPVDGKAVSEDGNKS